jgi:hypothetical protein
VPPGIYATHDDFDRQGRLNDDRAQRARAAGRGLVEMDHALARCSTLLRVEPQI